MFTLSPLPYRYDALEPWLSSKTLRFHHKRLHDGYVTRLNKLTRGTHLAQVPLDELVRGLDPSDPEQQEVWRMASQSWNHTFMFQSMKPGGGGAPRGAMRDLVGSPSIFRESFKSAARDVFGSGWVWLMASPGGDITLWPSTASDNPMRHGFMPLLNFDVWEHAYYLDYPAERETYVDVFLDHLANWDFASANYERAFG